MLSQLIRQFHLTRSERCGAAALLAISAACWLAPEVYNWWRGPQEPTDFRDFERLAVPPAALPLPKQQEQAVSGFPFDPNTASVETLVALGLPENLARTIDKYRSRGGRFRTAEDLQKIYNLREEDYERLRPFVRIGKNTPPAGRHFAGAATVAGKPEPETFPFDPNTATAAELRRLGLPEPLIMRLLRYREKGGYFFEKSDFRKLYGLSEADYTRLEPQLAIDRSQTPLRPAAYSGGSGQAPEIPTIDINTASPEVWQQLPGIGAARAKKIVWFRDKLGGFIQPEQVAETRDLPDSVFQQIRPYLRVESPVFKKIPINTASIAEIAGHPCFDFKQAQLIVAYREQHGPFRSAGDLARIAAFSDRQWLEKAVQYVRVE